MNQSASERSEKLSTGITCRTFCNRIYKCYYFREKDSYYLKGVRLLFDRILAKYKETRRLIIDIYAEELSSRSFTGIRRIPSDEKEEFRNFCTQCAINLSNLISSFPVENILDSYCYQWKFRGHIDGTLKASKDYNLLLSFENASLAQKDLDFATFNNYIYNITKGLANDCLVMSVPTNTFFLVPYNERDYTIGRGFLVTTKQTKVRIRGEHCLRCDQNCNPLWINGLDRLRSIT